MGCTASVIDHEQQQEWARSQTQQQQQQQQHSAIDVLNDVR